MENASSPKHTIDAYAVEHNLNLCNDFKLRSIWNVSTFISIHRRHRNHTNFQLKVENQIRNEFLGNLEIGQTKFGVCTMWNWPNYFTNELWLMNNWCNIWYQKHVNLTLVETKTKTIQLYFVTVFCINLTNLLTRNELMNLVRWLFSLVQYVFPFTDIIEIAWHSNHFVHSIFINRFCFCIFSSHNNNNRNKSSI